VAPPVGAVASGASGPALIPVLKSTGVIQLLYGVLFAVGLALA
jgi:1,4-dihydroxy-2-naphthoate octaprenyltransferase